MQVNQFPEAFLEICRNLAILAGRAAVFPKAELWAPRATEFVIPITYLTTQELHLGSQCFTAFILLSA